MICSLNPFYIAENVVVLPDFEGNWKVKTFHQPLISDTGQIQEFWRNYDTTMVWNIKLGKSQKTDESAKEKMTENPESSIFYDLILKDEFSDSIFFSIRMVLFQVEQSLYADFTPQENEGLSKSRIVFENYFPVHTLAKVFKTEQGFRLSWLGAENMKEMIEDKRARVSYKWIQGTNRLLLTGSSKQLTDMIKRYAGDPRFIDWEKQPALLVFYPLK